MKIERTHNFVTVVSISVEEMESMIRHFLTAQGYDVDLILETSSGLLSGQRHQITFLRKESNK